MSAESTTAAEHSTCARGAHAVDEAYELGAHEVFDVNAVDVLEALRTSHPDGVDAVLDVVNGPDRIGDDAGILKKGGKIVSTVHAANEGWFAERGITAHNISSKTNPFSSVKGLDMLGDMLVRHTIAPRIRRVVKFDDAELLEKVRAGGSGGKTLIQIAAF